MLLFSTATFPIWYRSMLCTITVKQWIVATDHDTYRVPVSSLWTTAY